MLTVAEILNPSVNNKWAVGAYDSPELGVTFGILDAALADDAPVIIMLTPRMAPIEHYSTYAAFIKREVERTGVNAALALDHGTTLVQIKAALEAGFTGVMIDASREPLEKNIAITKEVVDAAHRIGVSVEAELGHVGLGQDILPETTMKARYTSVEDAKRFVDETGVDALAVAIGTAHGVYKFEPKLDFDRLEQIRNEVDIPLVLHGSSGTPAHQLEKTVVLGINKINVYTDIRQRVMEKISEKVHRDPIEQYDMVDLIALTREETKLVVQDKNELFKAVGKASLY